MKSEIMPASVTLAGRSYEIIAICWVFTAVALMAVGARLYTRLRLRHASGLDDLAIAVAMVLELCFASLATASALTGTGKHQQTLLADQAAKGIRINQVTMVFAPLTFCVPKFAVVILLVRLLEPPKAVRLLFYTVLGILMMLCTLFAIILYVQCNGSDCWSPDVLLDIAIFTGAFSAAADLLFAAYPITVIRKLQITRGRKIGICILLALGVFACWASIYKCILLPSLSDRTDYLYATADLIIWTAIEANTIISAAALQCIGPFVQVMRDKGTSLANRISNRVYSRKRQSKYSDQLFGSPPQSPTRSPITAPSESRRSQRPFPEPNEELTMQHFAAKAGVVTLAGHTRGEASYAYHA